MFFLTVFLSAGAMLTAYLIGSIPTGVLLVRLCSGQDIRRLGSGNIGATNARRVAGNRLGALVLLGDVLKGGVPVWLASGIGRGAGMEGVPLEVCISLTALGAFLGHLYPIYFKGRTGGKGVATAAGGGGAISPMAIGGSLLIFVLVVWRFRIVSLGSMAASAGLPVLMWLASGSPPFTAAAAVMAAFIIVRHSGNIRRLREGTEPKI